ncbi:MAG: alkaline phosphatase D family protein [Deltaproteobacteria bacterium]
MKNKRFDRRTFLEGTAAVTGAAAFARCAPPPPPAPSWAWSGGVTPTDASVVVKALATEGRNLLVSTEPDLADARVFEPARIHEPLLRFAVDGLDPSTRYYYGLENDGTEGPRIGRFTTFPDGPSNLRLAFGSCADTGSNHVVFDAVRRYAPDFFLLDGDFHYEDISRNDVMAFRTAYDRAFGAARRAALHQEFPTAYVWDDHDFGPDNSDASAPGRPAAQEAYRQVVPHYALPAGESGPIHQAFSFGRTRFVMTDLRSARNRSAGTMLGADQRTWLLDELERAHATHALVVWVSTVAWISDRSETDSWGGFQRERVELGRAFTERGFDRMLMLSGDAHMLAIDNGRNNAHGGFPVFHAGPLDRSTSVKGGPYSEGTVTRRGQFGTVEVDDDGGDVIGVHLRGRNERGDTVIGHDFLLDVPQLEGV